MHATLGNETELGCCCLVQVKTINCFLLNGVIFLGRCAVIATILSSATRSLIRAAAERVHQWKGVWHWNKNPLSAFHRHRRNNDY